LSELEQLGIERDSLIKAVEELRQTVIDKETLLESLREQMASESEKYALQQQAMSVKFNSVMSELEEKKQELTAEQSESNVSLISSGESDGVVNGYQRHLEAMEEIESLQDTIAQQQTEIETLEADLTARDVEFSQVRIAIKTLEADVAARDVDLSQLRIKIETLEADLTARDVELSQLRIKIETLEGDMTAKDLEHSELRLKVKTLEGNLTARDADIETLEGDLTARDVELSQLRIKIASLETEVTGLRSSFSIQPGVGDGDDKHVGGKRDMEERRNEMAVSNADRINELEVQLYERNSIVMQIEYVLETLTHRSFCSDEHFSLIETIRTVVSEAIDGRQLKIENEQLTTTITEQRQEMDSLRLRLAQTISDEEEIVTLCENVQEESQDAGRQKVELTIEKQVRSVKVRY